jgi:hypothetical protein
MRRAMSKKREWQPTVVKMKFRKYVDSNIGGIVRIRKLSSEETGERVRVLRKLSSKETSERVRVLRKLSSKETSERVRVLRK